MQSFNCPLSTIALLCLALASFHGHLVHGQDFSFPTAKLTKDSLTFLKSGSVNSTGTLILDASAGDAQAFYKSPISLYNTISQSVHSFSTFFTYATSGNGTVAFVVTPEAAETGGLAAARKTFTIEFNTSCATRLYNGSGFYGGHAFPGRGGWGGRGGDHDHFGYGGLGGFQVLEYANNTAIPSQVTGGYGPNWTGQRADAPYFCSQEHPSLDLTNPTFQYQVILEYNATTGTVLLGSPSCGDAIARTTQFSAHDLSGVINKPVYVGFIVTGGGVFNLTQWNFTSNATTSSVSSLALSSTVDTTTGSSVSDGADGGGRHSNGSKLGKGYIIAFSVLGAAIGIGAVLALMCCLCAARRRRVTSARFVAKGVHTGTIPESAVVFDATKPPVLPAKMVFAERDTTPLNTHPNSTGTASWLQPVAPR